MNLRNRSLVLLAACAIAGFSLPQASLAAGDEAASTQPGKLVKADQPSTQHAAVPLQGPTQGSPAELSRLLDVVVNTPAPGDAYSVSLTSTDKKSSVSVDVQGGTKKIALLSSRTDSKPGNWTINDKTTASEKDTIASAISQAFGIAGDTRALSAVSSSAAKRH